MSKKLPGAEVGHAENVENAAVVTSAEHVAHVDTVTVARPLQKDSRWARALFAVAGLAFLVLVGGAMWSLLSVANNREDEAAQARKERSAIETKLEQVQVNLDSTQQQLVDAQQRAAAVDAESQLRRGCLDAYGRNITAANASELTSFIFLLAALTDPNADPATRGTLFTDQFPAVQASATDVDQAVKARDAYVAGGAQLPCPLPIPPPIV